MDILTSFFACRIQLQLLVTRFRGAVPNVQMACSTRAVMLGSLARVQRGAMVTSKTQEILRGVDRRHLLLILVPSGLVDDLRFEVAGWCPIIKRFVCFHLA
jgi:hypothetical protein